MRKWLNLFTISLAVVAALAQKPASAGDEHEHDWETLGESPKRCSCGSDEIGVRICTIKKCYCGQYRTTCGECKACGKPGQY